MAVHLVANQVTRVRFPLPAQRMRVAIGSTNPVKISAVKTAFKKIWLKKRFKFVSVEVSSGVSKQPMSDLESIRGAKNRAKLAMRKLNADFGVGLEGGVQKIGTNWFDNGWIVIINKKGVEGIGCSIKMLTPPKMMRLIKTGLELGDADDILFKSKNSKQKEGHFGHMTKNIITRTSGYEQAVISALVRFINPHLFD